jgi:carboxymethylenebutenolidase
MRHETVDIRTDDGTCPTHVFDPSDSGQWPGVVLFMDGHGVRPALFEIAERLAGGGYCVAMPDLYYRTGYKAPEGARLFSDEKIRADWMTRILPTLSIANVMRDVPAILGHLDARPTVRPGTIGVTGYCLGGRLSLAAAGHFPDRVAAAASYHGGHLATDAPDSPHRLASRMKARVYVAGAIQDASFDDAQKKRLEDALTAAHVDHKIETYNARHGWVPSDTPVHDEAATERHWATLFDLLGAALN